MSFYLASTIRRGASSMSVLSVSTQSKSSMSVCSDRRRPLLSMIGNPANDHTGAEKPLAHGCLSLRPKQSRFATIISVTAAFDTDARFSEYARTKRLRTAYSIKCSNRLGSRT
jgi:hypothetical protein